MRFLSLRFVAVFVVLLALIATDGAAEAAPAILLWPADDAAAPRTAEVAGALAERGGLRPVDEGPLRSRISEGPRVDPLVFVSEAGHVAESATAAIARDPDAAIAATHAPEREYLPDLATATGVRGLRALALVRARAFVKKGDRAAAQREARFAVALDVGGELDPRALTPDVRGLVEAALRERPTTATVVVNVSSAPVGARVTVDGRPVGHTPVDVELTPGPHVVRLDEPGFEPWAEIVEVSSAGPLASVTLRTAVGESLLEQLAALGAAGELSLEDAETSSLLGAAADVRYVGVVRATAAGTTVTVFDAAERRSPGVASGRTPSEVAAAVETLVLGAPARARGAPPVEPVQAESPPIYERWWFWVAAGAVVVAGGAAAIVLAQPEEAGVVRWGN